MDTYFIAAGAVLEAGPRSTATRATLHARLAGVVDPRVVLADLEAGSFAGLRRVIVAVGGATAAGFEAAVTARLHELGSCGIEEIAVLAAALADCSEIHVYARWQPPAELTAELAARGLALRMHPLEEIVHAALVEGTRVRRWEPAHAA